MAKSTIKDRGEWRPERYHSIGVRVTFSAHNPGTLRGGRKQAVMACAEVKSAGRSTSGIIARGALERSGKASRRAGFVKVCAVGSNPRKAFGSALRALAKARSSREGAFAGLGRRKR